MLKTFRAWLKRRALIKSAQKKVLIDGNAKRVTGEEWNALAYAPLRKAIESTRIPHEEILRKVKK